MEASAWLLHKLIQLAGADYLLPYILLQFLLPVWNSVFKLLYGVIKEALID